MSHLTPLNWARVFSILVICFVSAFDVEADCPDCFKNKPPMDTKPRRMVRGVAPSMFGLMELGARTTRPY
jgi:hypothetical protein